MPLWQLLTPENAYTPEEKADIATKITNIYSSDWSRENFGFELPKFYTSVVFHEVKADSFFVGGESRDNFVQIEVVHIARTNEQAAVLAGITVEEILKRYFENVNSILKPYTLDRGLEVEFHVETAWSRRSRTARRSGAGTRRTGARRTERTSTPDRPHHDPGCVPRAGTHPVPPAIHSLTFLQRKIPCAKTSSSTPKARPCAAGSTRPRVCPARHRASS
jgi:phenylpyruvate tautomerase PptA (4-oxalocrotonate tautomerase family)